MTTTTAARIAEIDEELAAYRTARLKVVTGGQAYTAEGRQMTRADLPTLLAQEKELRVERARLVRGGRFRTFGVVHR